MSDRTWRALRPGDRIVEKQHNSTIKEVVEVVPDQYVMARGFNLRRISWNSLRRYRILSPEERS